MRKQRILCIVICAAVLIGVGGWVILRQIQRQQSSPGVAEISIDGEVRYTYDLGKTYAVPETISIPANGGENVLEIGTGYVRMVSADCPDQICVKTGSISKPGETIVCLPHRVAVTIREKGADNENGVDAQA